MDFISGNERLLNKYEELKENRGQYASLTEDNLNEVFYKIISLDIRAAGKCNERTSNNNFSGREITGDVSTP